MASEHLTCRELVELVTEYLQGKLSERDQACFERHLGTCSHCRAYVEQMRQTIHVLGTLDEQSLSPKARDELLRVFRDWNNV